jgi:hypothetical protein
MLVARNRKISVFALNRQSFVAARVFRCAVAGPRERRRMAFGFGESAD